MNQNNIINGLFRIIKFSTIFIMMFQGKLIFDLRSENLNLNKDLAKSKIHSDNSYSEVAELQEEMKTSEEYYKGCLSERYREIPNDLTHPGIKAFHSKLILNLIPNCHSIVNNKNANIASLKTEIKSLGTEIDSYQIQINSIIDNEDIKSLKKQIGLLGMQMNSLLGKINKSIGDASR